MRDGALTATDTGDTLAPGTAIGVVKSLRDATSVSAVHGGVVVEWLVEEGDPVSPGQPLIRLHPVSALD